ncbi:MAG: phospho-sugar mutase [Flavobacteriales bacterium]
MSGFLLPTDFIKRTCLWYIRCPENFNMSTIDITAIQQKAAQWIASPVIDEETKNEIQQLLASNEKELIESFYSDLEFGTGGLRGIMGVGTMRMNVYTVGMATQGLANYILAQFPQSVSRVAIAFDSRNNSKLFAQTAANVLSANGIEVHMFDELRPTPLLSYAVRALKCQSGIVITASHNPKEYNGYKVYWEDGAQVLPPHDKGIIAEVRKITKPDDVKFNGNSSLIHSVDASIEESYFEEVKKLIHAPDAIQQATNLKIVYTSIHGAGITMVPRALEICGFKNIHVVEEQAVPDGNFSTVQSPNPEEREALNLALKLAEEKQADLVIGTDPDTDRVGMAIRNEEGQLVLLNGNQAACLLVYYQLQRMREKNAIQPNHYIAKTIVTTDLLEEIARIHGVKWYDTLTGFKYIAGVIREKEGKEIFIAGGEESYGYSVGEFVRDKDAVLSSVVLCEIAAWCAAGNRTVWSLLMEIYEQCGLYHESLLSVTMKGLDGLQQIQAKMASLRANPPKTLAGSPVIELRDIQLQQTTILQSGEVKKLDLPASNVLQFVLQDGSKISARPSGTEPKIKFYFSMKAPFQRTPQYKQQVAEMEKRMVTIQEELGMK